jgi:nicotinate-nucleotide--dimethylbenzimidazole phosphoribosyltransferase
MDLKDLQHKIDFKTKPLGSLGLLEKIAFQIGAIQNSLSPQLLHPNIVVFAGDHGAAIEGISPFPQAVTTQMVLNFLDGGAAINVFCNQNAIELTIVDAGIVGDLPNHPQLIKVSIAKGTENYTKQNAITLDQLKQCEVAANNVIESIVAKGCNIIGFGEMGIGNTSSASIIMAHFCKLPIEDCVGIGTGCNDEQLAHKKSVLKNAILHLGQASSTQELLQKFGGFEIAMMCFAFIAAHKKGMVIMVDGFIATAAYCCALDLEPSLKTAALFCHSSEERGHEQLLNYLNATPILKLNMRLGEGSACALAYPIIKSAVHFLNEMASFESAAVSNKSK